ncbi:hypothetical protein [Actinomadura logoneensis]|uniref:hypothetical protein n=1 Tax=Actinomadura logoneensis TaxID=2293572 RepID=UPI0011C19AF7|nr:hypothetical protein [Actinomadura logoneensis]
MKTPWAMAAAVTLLLTTSACGGGKGVNSAGDDPRILVHHGYGNDWPKIMYVGELVYDSAGRCLHFRSESGETKAPVWPEGTKPVLKGDKRGVKIPGFGELLEGEKFNTGGAGAAEQTPKNLPSSCIPKGGTIVFNADVKRQR